MKADKARRYIKDVWPVAISKEFVTQTEALADLDALEAKCIELSMQNDKLSGELMDLRSRCVHVFRVRIDGWRKCEKCGKTELPVMATRQG